METKIFRDAHGNVDVAVTGTESPEAVTRGYQSVVKELFPEKGQEEEAKTE